MVTAEELLEHRLQPHALKVEGSSALIRDKVRIQGKISPGDYVEVFQTPDQGWILKRIEEPSASSYKIAKVTSAFIVFEDEPQVTIK